MARKPRRFIGQMLGDEGFQRWISPDALTLRLDALFYHPAFDELPDLAVDRPGQLVLLKDICSAISTQQASNSAEPTTPGASFPYVTASSFHSGQFVDVKASAQTISDSEATPLLLNQESVLVSLVSDVPQLAAFYSPAIHGGPIALSRGICALAPGPAVDAAYLAHELNQRYVALQVLRLPSGTTIPLLRIEDILDLQVAVPHRAKQQPISTSIRARASLLEVPTTEGAPELGAPAGATFVQVLDKLESQVVQFSETAKGPARLLEWLDDEPRQHTAVVRALPRSQSPVLSKKFMPTGDLLDWLIERTEPFCIFNAIHAPRLLDYPLCRQLGLIPPSDERTAGAIFSLFEAWSSGPGPIGAFQELVRTNRPTQRVFGNEKGAYEAIEQICRPILALRLTRTGRRYGVILVAGPRQWPDTVGAYETLRTQGVIWASYLRQQLQLLPELQKHGAEQTVTNLVHRLKHPLQKIDTAVAMLKRWADTSGIGDQVIDDHSLSHYLQRIRDAQTELVNLSGKIRAMARAESCGKPDYVPLTQLIPELVKCTNNFLNGKNCPITFDVDSSAEGFAYADPDLLCEAMFNVLENALREMERGQPRLEVRIRPQVPRPGQLTIEVIDNGLPEETELIPDPFGWGTTTHFKSGRGSGYGLPFVRQVFLSVLGDCGLEKNPHGPGCRFWGTLQFKTKALT